MFEMISRIYQIAGSSRKKNNSWNTVQYFKILFSKFYDAQCIFNHVES